MCLLAPPRFCLILLMIEALNLTRTFGKRRAVDNVSFSVEAGEIFGFLGHNGAGKTTTIRMLTGQLRPSSGRAFIGDYDVVQQRDAIKSAIGVVPETQNIYERMSGRENLILFADLYRLNRARVSEVLELVNLTERAKDKTETYSNGMKQRLLIARALLPQPKVLFLDEPTRGLDPASARDIRQSLKTLAQTGTTIFLTTHYMEEADELCGRVAFMSEGKLIAVDTPRNFKLNYGKRQARVLLTGNAEHVISLSDPADAAQWAAWHTAGQILAVHSQEATLEEVFIRLAGRNLDS